MAEESTTQPKTDEPAGTTILTAKEPEKPSPEKTLFPTVDEAKAAAIKELESKQAADKATADKALADKAAADAAKKAEEDKAKTGEPIKTPPDKGAPAKTDYNLALPENSPLTQEDLTGLMKEAKESGLSEEEAKELLQQTDTVARTAQTRLVKQQEEQMKTMVASWKDAVKKDPELGGDKLAETAIKASRAFKAVASKEMQIFCEKTGYAEHPELVRMMVKIHDLIGEDRFIKGSTGVQSNKPTTMEEKAKKLFGNPIKEAAIA